MQRIDTTTAVAVLPAPDALGTPGYFTKGNPGPGTPVPATNFSQDWCNQVQEEIVSVILASGLTLDKTNNAQLLSALTGGRLGRTRLLVNTTFHISATGNDSTGNGTSGAPWATFAHAIAILQNNYDTNGKTVTFQWDSASACTETINVAGPQVGVTSPSQYVFDFNSQPLTSSSAANFACQQNALALIQNVTLSNSTATNGLVASDRGYILIGTGVNFGPQAAGIQILAQFGGRIACVSPYTISGGGLSHAQANIGGVIDLAPGTITLTGTPAFTLGFASAANNATTNCKVTTTFSGSATGPRYSAALNGVVNSNGGGATFFPGNAVGATATGGQYA